MTIIYTEFYFNFKYVYQQKQRWTFFETSCLIKIQKIIIFVH